MEKNYAECKVQLEKETKRRQELEALEVSMKQEKNDLAEKMERQNSLLEDAESRCENLIDAKIDLDGKIRDLQDSGSN